MREEQARFVATLDRVIAGSSNLLPGQWTAADSVSPEVIQACDLPLREDLDRGHHASLPTKPESPDLAGVIRAASD